MSRSQIVIHQFFWMAMATGRPPLHVTVTPSRPLNLPSSLRKGPAQRLVVGDAPEQCSVALAGVKLLPATNVYLSASDFPVKVPLML